MPNENVATPDHQLRFVPFVLKLYAAASNPTPASFGLVMLKLHDVHSTDDALVKVNVGAVPS